MTTYSAATDLNAAATTGTLKTSTTTGLSLTAAKQINAININTNSTAITSNGSLLPSQGLTLGAGAVLVNGTGATISAPVLALSAEGIFRVNSGQDLTVSSRITGGSGLTKTGAGEMTLSKLQEYTGTTTVNQGMLKLASGLGKNALLVTVTNGNPSAPTLQMNGGTFDLNGNSLLVGSIQSVNQFAGGTVTSSAGGSAATLTSFIGGDTTFGGNITGNLNFDFKASGGFSESILTLKSEQSYTGSTSIRSGILTLQDKGALYSGVGDLSNASVALNHATLRLDNSGLNTAATPPARIPSTVPITLNYGVIQTIAGASADNVNTLGTVTVDRGLNLVALNAAQANTGTAIANSQGATNTLTITNLANNANGGLVNLFAYSNSLGAYTNNQAQRLFITNVNGSPVTAGAMLPAWVGIGNGTGNGTLFTDFATLSSTGFGIVGFGDTTLGGPGYAGTFASGNVTSVGATALAAATTITKALKLTGALTFGAASNVLNLESGGLITIGASIGGAANSGHLTAGGATPPVGPVDLVLANGSATAMTVNSIIEDNGATKVRLILTDGNGTMTLAGNNTYSGGTIVSAGREGQSHFILGGSGVIIPAGGLILQPNINSQTQRAFTTTAAGQIHPSNDVTIMGAGYGLTMATGTTNTLSSLIFNNNGGGRTSNLPLVDVATKLILTKTTGNGAIDATNDSMSSIPKIQGTELNLPDGATITTSGDAPVSLNIATTSLTTAAATLALHKAGSGSLILTPQSTFLNNFNLDAGTIIFTASSVGGGTGGTAPTTSQIGRGTLTLADGTAIMGSAALSLGNVIATANGATFTFGTLDATNARANATNNLTLTNTVTLGTGAQGINVNGLNMTGTISGQITGGGTGFTKGGPGTLVLNNATNNFTGSVTINGGTLQHNVAGSIPTGRIMTVAAGAAFNMNAIAQSIDSLNGAGSVINPGAAAVLTINGTTNGSFSGVLAATTAANLSLVKDGINTQILSGANVYGGATTITAGTLVAANAAALGTTAAGTTVASSATLDVQANIGTEAINVQGTGVGGNGALVTGSGTGTVGGTVTLAADTSIGGAGTLNINGVVAAGPFIVDKVGAGTTNFGTTSTLTSLGTLNATDGTTNVNSVVGTGTSVVAVTGTTSLKFGSVSQTLGSLSIGAGSTVTFTSGLASFSGGDGGKVSSSTGSPSSFGGGSAVVPEPSTMGLLLVGALGVLNRRRRNA